MFVCFFQAVEEAFVPVIKMSFDGIEVSEQLQEMIAKVF